MSDSRGRVLLVEDTPTQAEVARALLADMGHEVRHAETGARGLALALDWLPDAILVDLQLPDFSGFELMRRLRAEGSRGRLHRHHRQWQRERRGGGDARGARWTSS